MHYYEVLVADKRYQSDKRLTYSSELGLSKRSVVSLPIQNRVVTGFVERSVSKPKFATKQIKAQLSDSPLPEHCFELAQWLADYYVCSMGEALRQFAPSTPSLSRAQPEPEASDVGIQLDLTSELTPDQAKAIKAIENGKATTYLLHGDTGTGKTRVYLELAKKTLESDRSVILLTPEIALTSQLESAVKQHLPYPAFVFHSHLTPASRKRLWIQILESKGPIIVIGARSALFTPVSDPGLIIIDEAHEPAYKQDQSPRYQTSRVASQLAVLSKAKVILGTATPLVSDYYLAEKHGTIITMKTPAVTSNHPRVKTDIVDIKERQNFTIDHYLSNKLIDDIRTTLSAKKQVMIYLNRRGTARIVMCNNCGWQLLCPHCDVPMVYHGDSFSVQCHICGRSAKPPLACPQCSNSDLVYRSIGTKSLTDSVAKLFPEARIARFDSDNKTGERVHELYGSLQAGEIDILIGTQLLAKGFDLPKLALVGIVSAESSLALPDFTAEERTFQLLYQVSGRVGRGHTAGKVIIQTYDPENIIIKSAAGRNWLTFYKYLLKQRQAFRFPPYAYLGKFICRRASPKSAETAGLKLRHELLKERLQVEIVGPTPSFYGKRNNAYYWQIILKSKSRSDLVKLAKLVPANWSVDLDPNNLL